MVPLWNIPQLRLTQQQISQRINQKVTVLSSKEARRRLNRRLSSHGFDNEEFSNKLTPNVGLLDCLIDYLINNAIKNINYFPPFHNCFVLMMGFFLINIINRSILKILIPSSCWLFLLLISVEEDINSRVDPIFNEFNAVGDELAQSSPEILIDISKSDVAEFNNQ